MNDDHPLYVGGHGRFGASTSGKLTNSLDLLIIIDCSSSNNTNLLSRPTIQIDIDIMVIGKKHPIDLSIIGNNGKIVPSTLMVEKSNKNEYLSENKSLKDQ